MKLTKRDLEILQFINACGYCNVLQLGKRFSMKWWIVYRRMSRLINAGFAVHRRIYFEGKGVYYLTSHGAGYTDLPPIDGISKGGYDHQILLIDLVLKLQDIHPEVAWISERHLKQQQFFYGVGKLGHVADGLLVFPDNRKVAIELELTQKSRLRLEKILRGYGAKIEIDEVWYFCSDNLISAVSDLSKNKTYIKVFSHKEFINAQYRR